MKKATSILAGIAGALFLMVLMPVPAHAMADTIFAKIVPSETQAVDTSGARFVATPSKHYMDVSESQVVDTSGPAFVVTPASDLAAGSIVARVAPSETQKSDIGLNAPQAVAKAPKNLEKKCTCC